VRAEAGAGAGDVGNAQVVSTARRSGGIEEPGHPPLVNVGCGEDLTIAELAAAVRDAVGSRAKIVYDRSKPDGPPASCSTST
jgi:GDP-L-fucose synthase